MAEAKRMRPAPRTLAVAGVLFDLDGTLADSAGDLSAALNRIRVGRGMTAIDIAVQSKKLGAETVTMVYRRGPDEMKASAYERELAQTSGVVIRYWARPIKLEGHSGALSGVVFESATQR